MSYEDNLQFLEEFASRSIAQAIVTRDDLWGLVESEPQLGPTNVNYQVQEPNREEPPQLSELLSQLGGDALEDIPEPNAEWLDGQADQWMADYFPGLSTLSDVPDRWLAEVMAKTADHGISVSALSSAWSRANGVSDEAGIQDFSSIWSTARSWVSDVTSDPDVYTKAWERARSRAEVTRRTEYNNIESGFSARGFSMPTGAMITALDEANQRASNTPLELNVEQALREVEVRLQLDQTSLGTASEQALRDAAMKNDTRIQSAQLETGILEANQRVSAQLAQTAAQLAVQLRTDMLRSMADFYRSWTSLYSQDKQLDRAQVKAQIISEFQQAWGRHYDVSVAFEQLRMEAANMRVGAKTTDDRNKINLHGMRERKSNALAQAVRGFADICSAAASASSSLTAEIESI